jgi:hypothetical protein
MPFKETIAVYYENHTENTDTRTVRTSQETYYVSAKEPNRLMLFEETVAVYCENYTEHTDAVHASQEARYVSATETNRFMLFRETVAVYYENHAEHTYTVRTSQQTHYVSPTETNRLMLFGEQDSTTSYSRDPQFKYLLGVRLSSLMAFVVFLSRCIKFLRSRPPFPSACISSDLFANGTAF